jgi:hypothetical protein
MATKADSTEDVTQQAGAAPSDFESYAARAQSIKSPHRTAWREEILAKAEELDWMSSSFWGHHPEDKEHDLAKAVQVHLDAARNAASYPQRWYQIMPTKGSLLDCAKANLYAAEAAFLNAAQCDYLLGLMPSLLAKVRRHLVQNDPRRQEVERIACNLGIAAYPKSSLSPEPARKGSNGQPEDPKKIELDKERGKIIAAVRAASSASLREQMRVRSFRNVLVATAVVMALLAVGIALLGIVSPTAIPLCFEPEQSGQTTVVCPTGQVALTPTSQQTAPTVQAGPTVQDVDDAISQAATWRDLLIVELVGLTAAAIAAAAAIRGIRGSSEPYGLPVALAALKLPTGAVTAFLGLLLMRGRFVPGLTALDTSAQILAWALVFGYAQQLLTRFVDRQAHTVLDSVRNADKGNEPDPARA